MNNPNEFEDIIDLLTDDDEIPAPNPLRKASARHNYLVYASQLRGKRSHKRESAIQSIFTGFRMAFRAMVVVLLVVSGLLTGTIYASADSLPGDLLYPVSLKVEEAQLGLQRDPERAARLVLSFAEKRLDDVDHLLEANRQIDIPLALKTYQQIITKPQLTEISARGEHAEINIVIIETLASQRERLLEFRSHVVLQNSAAFESVITVLDIELQRHTLSIFTPEIPEDDTASPMDLENLELDEIGPSDSNNSGQNDTDYLGSDDLGLENPDLLRLENPGLIDNPGLDDDTPPGLIDNPGLDDDTPPGLIDNPGLDDDTPPGLIDNPGLEDSVPPGHGGSPPGQDKDKDKDKP